MTAVNTIEQGEYNVSQISIEDFDGKCDSLYALIIAAARRAAQLSKPDSRPLVSTDSKKPTIVALEEIIQGKVIVKSGLDDDEVFTE